MANFHTHIGVSSALGVAYGSVGHLVYGVDVPPAVLAAGLCGVAGMLPDLDSDHGVPLRESMAFLAAVVPMLMLDRFRQLQMSQETIVLTAGFLYFFVRFWLTTFVRRYTVHRGMWHSIPAAAIAGLATYLLCADPEMRIRLFKTGAVVTGFLSHLILDEIWSIEVGRLRVKKSFGTAFKFFGRSPWGNLSVYGKLVALSVFAFYDPPVDSLSPRYLQPIQHAVEAALPVDEFGSPFLESSFQERPFQEPAHAANETYEGFYNNQPVYDEFTR